MSSLWCHVQFSVKFLICPLLPALLYYSSTITDKAKDTSSLFFSFLPPQRFQTLLDFQILYRGAGLRVDSYRPWSLHTLVCVVWNSIWVGVQECYLPFIHRFMWGIKSTVFFNLFGFLYSRYDSVFYLFNDPVTSRPDFREQTVKC